MFTSSTYKDNASKGHAVAHNPQNTHEDSLTDTKSISINPRAIGTNGPNLNEELGHTSLQIPQPTQFLSSYFKTRFSSPSLFIENIKINHNLDIAWFGQF